MFFHISLHICLYTRTCLWSYVNPLSPPAPNILVIVTITHPAGAAPVFDSCGMAGGHKPPQGGFGGIYVNTTHAKVR